MIAAKNVDTSATLIDSSMASTSAGYLNGSRHAPSENPFQTKLNFPTGSLNEKRTITKIGANSRSRTKAAYTARSFEPSQRSHGGGNARATWALGASRPGGSTGSAGCTSSVTAVVI